jgi:sirohydrochlorin cobaltochelatase
MNKPTTALILFAHGSSDPAWATPFAMIREALITKLPATRIELAYLERMSPSLEEAVVQLAQDGVQQITVAPLFLGVGGHMRNDFPALLAQARQQSGVTIDVLPTLGEAPEITEAIANVLAGWVGKH